MCHRAPPGSTASAALLLRTPPDTQLSFSGHHPHAALPNTHPMRWRGTPDGMAAGSATPQSHLRHLLQQKTFPPLPGVTQAHRAPNVLLLLSQLSPTQPTPSAHQCHCGHSTGMSNSSSASLLCGAEVALTCLTNAYGDCICAHPAMWWRRRYTECTAKRISQGCCN